jgi:hypothetical protein
MAAYGIENETLTGRWVGFYRHRSEELGTYPIIAELVQSGSSISGEMYDQITEQSHFFDEFVEVISRQTSSATKSRMERMSRQLGPAAVRNSRLPDTSDIQGRIRGSQVAFTKTYRGPMEITWTVSEQIVAEVRHRKHRVHYSGQLDLEHLSLTGKWIIPYPGLLGWILPPAGVGSFELYKKS